MKHFLVKQKSPMASSTGSLCHQERRDHELMRVLVTAVSNYILELLVNPETWSSLKMRCKARVKTQTREFFEFSEQLVLSNLYWGVKGIESVIKENSSDQRELNLDRSEQMLQIPALLNEDKFTAGIPNHYLICFSYIYLSALKKLQGDELQVTLHFLQAIIVSPSLVSMELAQELCRILFPWCPGNNKIQTSELRSSPDDIFREKNVEETIKQTARRYKELLTYYRVTLYGENLQWPDEFKVPPLNNHHHSKNWETRSSREGGNSSETYKKFQKVYPFDYMISVTDRQKILPGDLLLNQSFYREISQPSCERKSIRDILQDASSSDSCSDDSAIDDQLAIEDNQKDQEMAETSREYTQAEFFQQKQEARCLDLNLQGTVEFANGTRYDQPNPLKSFLVNDEHPTVKRQCRLFSHFLSRYRRNSRFQKAVHIEGNAKKEVSLYLRMKEEISADLEWAYRNELEGILEDAASQLLFSKGLQNYVEDQSSKINIIYETLNKKVGVMHSLLKEVITDILLTEVSTSWDVDTIRASVAMLSTIVLHNKSAVEEIKMKGLRLDHLVKALKHNVNEAAVLIYLINPPTAEIINLELLPTLLEVVCNSINYKSTLLSPLPTPPVASLMIIEELITTPDHDINGRHLAQVSSPRILSALLEHTKNKHSGEIISLASVVTKCMRFDGKCRQYVMRYFPMGPFIFLLQSNKKQAWITALEFFHEILCSPRSSVIGCLQLIQKEGCHGDITCKLMLCLQQLEPKYQLIAANFLLHLLILDASYSNGIHREETVKIILELAVSEVCPDVQTLSSTILSNLGGTYAWTGEPYTIAWLVKKTGLTSLAHKNMIKNIDWQDETLQDDDIDVWSSKMAQILMKVGNSALIVLGKGLKSSVKSVSKGSLAAVAWIGCEIAKNPNIKMADSDILLKKVEKFLHPGSDLDERLLACLSIYNYASAEGMQKVTHFNEGVKESLRRLSKKTWMADELLKVAYYIRPQKTRISCVHTQILEAGQGNAAVTALTYYRGQLYSGHRDGSIKVWEIKEQTASLVLDVREHRKAVTCFSLHESGNLMSSSADKTIRLWKMHQKKLECTEVIVTQIAIESMAVCGQQTFFISKEHSVKVLDASRTIKDACKRKRVKCMHVAAGKVYLGCMDSSIQEINVKNSHEREIKEQTRDWRLHSRPINSISVYNDWLYSASTIIQGSHIKEWRKNQTPQVSIGNRGSDNFLAMAVVEDFIYLNCSTSPSVLQIWLRGSHRQVGRLSAGSKITCLLAANDMILCGTDSGLIKGWIPL